MTTVVPYTRVPGLLVPALPNAGAADLLALQFQLGQSQWWPADSMAGAHKAQFTALLSHVWEQVPFYRDRLEASGWMPGALVSAEQFRRLPRIRRAEVLDAGEAFQALALPEGHGEVSDGSTSGSTGQAVRYWHTDLFGRLQYAFHLRHYLWHRWDFTRAVASILVDRDRIASAPQGKTYPNWGPWLAEIYPTGPHHFLSARADIEQQLDWLEARRPAYLITYPSNLDALLDAARQRGMRLPYLRGVSTLGELVSGTVREKVRDHFGWPLIDVYSASEIGYLAIQCPRHEHYHVQAENVILEVLDDHGMPCQPGQIGKVVVSTLHNFAAPLIRYEIGDYAEVGEACDCGRHLPVLKRILGRSRNMLKRPDGVTTWPHFGTAALHREAPIRQFQVAQTAVDRIELRLVVEGELSAQTELRLKQILTDNLEYPFAVDIVYCDGIERSEGGKFEDFICLV